MLGDVCAAEGKKCAAFAKKQCVYQFCSDCCRKVSSHHIQQDQDEGTPPPPHSEAVLNQPTNLLRCYFGSRGVNFRCADSDQYHGPGAVCVRPFGCVRTAGPVLVEQMFNGVYS